MSNTQVANSQPENGKTQDLVAESGGNTQLAALREKIARKLCDVDGWEQDRLMVAGSLKGEPKWKLYLEDADASIFVILEELSRMKLPLPLLSNEPRFDKELKDLRTAEFRGVIFALLEQFRKEAAQ